MNDDKFSFTPYNISSVMAIANPGHILSGTSIPSNPIPERMIFAIFSDNDRRNTFRFSFSSRKMLKS